MTQTLPQRLMLDIQGMHCAGCVSTVENALKKSTGVDEAHVNLATAQASVVGSGLSETNLVDAVKAAGYSASVVSSPAQSQADRQVRERAELAGWRTRFVTAVILLAGILVAGLFHHRAPSIAGIAQFILAAILQGYVGWPYMVGTIRQLARGTTSMDTLIALGTTVAFVAGAVDLWRGHMSMTFLDGALILCFISLGRYLEIRAKGRASEAIRKLLDLAPPEALVQRGTDQIALPVEQVTVGDLIVVRPGEKIPLDAEVITGTSDVDESWLTGEPLPVAKKTADKLFAGTLNGSGALTAKVTSTSNQTALAQVIDLVQKAQESKADVQRLADRVVTKFVPAVLLIAAATFLAWWLWGQNLEMAIACTVAVLVTACPCALGLATPAAVMVGSGRGAELGILIKDATALEVAGRLNTVVLDKTGTITSGHPHVVAVVPRAEIGADELLCSAAGAESLSSHPLARAVTEHAKTLGLTIPSATSLQVIPGEGVTTKVDRRDVVVGNESLLQRFHVELSRDILREVRSRRDRGETALLVASDGRMLGAIFVADTIPQTSRQAVRELQELGMKVVMLTGDKQATAQSVAESVGISDVISEVKPDEKSAHISSLRKDKSVVAMVGDGINDAPALAAADLGIAIGSGADVAIESADMVLRGADLMGVPRAIQLARATLRTIRQNLVWAFVYNILLLPLATGMFVPWFGLRLAPSLAAAAMAASSVSVVANSLRLRRRKLVG